MLKSYDHIDLVVLESYATRVKISNKTTNLPITISLTHINTRCVITGRKK